MPDGVGSAYLALLRQARARNLAIGRQSVAQLEAGFRLAIEAFARQAGAQAASPLTRARATSMRDQAEGLLSELETLTARTTARGVALTVDDLRAAHARVTRDLRVSLNGDEAEAFARIAGRFDQLPIRAIAAFASRPGGSAAVFRTLMRRHIEDAAPALDRLLIAGIAQGVSSRQLTLDIVRLFGGREADLRPYGLSRKAGAGIRSLRADARRIAVSEINNAYREANAQQLASSPIVLAVRWQVSGRHDALREKYGEDECDVLAEVDFYGYGAGYYPPEHFPFAPHSNCGCQSGGPVKFRPVSEWDKPKPPAASLQLSAEAFALQPAWEKAWTPNREATIRAQVAASLRGGAGRSARRAA